MDPVDPDSDPQHWPGERGCGARGQVLQQAHVPGVHLALTRLVVKTGPETARHFIA